MVQLNILTMESLVIGHKWKVNNFIATVIAQFAFDFRA